jgi:hypothetical protein
MAEESTAVGATASAPAAAPEAGKTAQTSAAPAQAAKVDGKGTASAPASAAQAPAKTEQASAAPTSWDDDTVKWMSSKGYEPTAFDYSNETHKKLIQSNRASEAEISRKQNEAKNREILQRAKIKTESAQVKKLDPLEEYEKNFDAEIKAAMRFNNCETVQELQERNPEIYNQLDSSYLLGRMDAVMKVAEWREQQKLEAESQKQEAESFRKQMLEAAKFAEKNLSELRQKNPKLDENFRDSGADKILNSLNETHSLPRELLFMTPEIASFFAESADAIMYKRNEPARYEAWKAEYEKSKLGIESASAPIPAGTAIGAVPNVFLRGHSYGDKLDAAFINRK